MLLVRGAPVQWSGSSGGGQKRRKVPLVNAKCTYGVRVPQLFLQWCWLGGVREKRKIDESYIHGGVTVGAPPCLSSQQAQHISLRTIYLSEDAELGSVWVSSYWLILLFPQASIFPSVFLSTVVPQMLLKKKKRFHPQVCLGTMTKYGPLYSLYNQSLLHTSDVPDIVFPLSQGSFHSTEQQSPEEENFLIKCIWETYIPYLEIHTKGSENFCRKKLNFA